MRAGKIVVAVVLVVVVAASCAGFTTVGVSGSSGTLPLDTPGPELALSAVAGAVDLSIVYLHRAKYVDVVFGPDVEVLYDQVGVEVSCPLVPIGAARLGPTMGLSTARVTQTGEPDEHPTLYHFGVVVLLVTEAGGRTEAGVRWEHPEGYDPARQWYVRTGAAF